MEISKDFETQIIESLAVYSCFKRSIFEEFTSFLMSKNASSYKGSKVLGDILEKQLKRYSKKLSKRMLDNKEFSYTAILKSALTGVKENPFTDKELDAVENFSELIIGDAEIAINNQMNADVRRLKACFSRFHLKVSMNTGHSMSHEAAVRLERSKVIPSVESYCKSAVGFHTDSELYVQRRLRSAFYKTFNTSMTYFLTKIGDDRARIESPRMSNNTSFRLEEYEDIENKFFHLNSVAIVLPMA